MPRREEALAAMRDALQLQDPEWDIVPGTPEYKILEAVAQQIENLTYNSVLNDYHFDVDKKAGLELEIFMALFGFARIKARRATGEVTFQRGTPALVDYPIPLGTQVFVPATATTPSIFFQTTSSAVLPTGATEVSVPIQAVVAGTIGNTSSGTISGLATSIGGVTAVYNAQPTTGGRDAESDADLRARWRRSVFRNISGTEDQFLGMAFNESAFVTRANVVGPVERYREQIQLAAPYDLTTTSPWQGTLSVGLNAVTTSVSLTAGHGDRFSLASSVSPIYIAIYNGSDYTEVMKVTNRVAGGNTLTVERAVGAVTHSGGSTVRQVFPSSVPDSAYDFSPGGEVVGLNINLSTQQVGRRGVDYEFITTSLGVPVPAGIAHPILYPTVTGASAFGVDSVLEVEHEYTPLSSRNDPGGSPSIADKVDMFIDGEDEQVVVEQFPFRLEGLFGTSISLGDYMRDNGVDAPKAGNYFTQLSKAPVVSVPDSITVAATGTSSATTYYKDEDFWLVVDQTEMDGSPRAADGLEWKTPGAQASGLFSITRQLVAGNLDGWYGYQFTYEVDGVESLPNDPEVTDGRNDPTTDGKNVIDVPLWGGGGAVVWRKVYRSEAKPTSTSALAGPFYLLKLIKDNVETAFTDNKLDDKLRPIFPPKELPPVDAPVVVEYSYNELIERVDAQVDLVRLVGMDTLVHAAEEVLLKFNLAVVLVPGMNITDATSDISTQLSAWIRRKDFLNNIQIADMIDTVASAPGVDNVRLARESEIRNEVQKITVTYGAAPDAARDTWTITIGDDTTGVLAYDETALEVREALEALPNIQEGNTFATYTAENVDGSETQITVTDVASLHEGGVGGAALLQNYYIEIGGGGGTEIMEVTSASDAGATVHLEVRRAVLGSAAINHGASPINVHILGDVAVARTTGTYSYSYTISFLPNLYNDDDNWGHRNVDPVVVAKGQETSELTFLVEQKVKGVGWGIQHMAHNGRTIVTTYDDDFYLASDELPALFAVDVLVKAQNTF